MKRFRIVAALALLCAGCCGPAQIALVGVDQGWKVIGPRYREYVQADPQLKSADPARQAQLDAMKADWLRTADKMDQAIADGLKAR